MAAELHHRSQFTTSRFVGRPADEEQTSILTPAADSNAHYGTENYGTENYGNSDYTSDYTPDGYYTPPSYPASDYANESSYQSTDYTGGIDGYRAPSQKIPATTRRGTHRIPTPPSALKGRAAVLAVAAGAVVAAGQASWSQMGSGNSDHSDVTLAAESQATPAAGATAEPQAAPFSGTVEPTSTSSNSPQVLNVANPTDMSQFSNILAKGQRFSDERAAREAAARRPLFVLPAVGTFTSNFGTRWGVLHAGVDIAAPIGTPIVAVADGEVINAGPASGFGMWVRLLHADGTITVYGHVNTTVVSVGQHVMAGDQIATVGNRGESTGPHCHFEVHLPGEQKIDPLPWLASRGISLGVEQD